MSTTPIVPTPMPRRSMFVGGMLLVSAVLNVVALCLPFVVVDAVGVDAVTYGLFGSVQMLLDAHMMALAVMVIGFSIVFPFAKLCVLTWVWWNGARSAGQRWALARVEALGKWSLFDVFLVAIMVAVTNDQWLISSTSLPGLTCFLAAIVISMLAGEVLSLSVSHPPPTSPRAPASIMRCLFLLVVGALLAAALFVPFIEISDWRLVDRPYSLWELAPALWQNGSAVLSLTLGIFVIAVPLLHWLTILLARVFWWRRPLPASCAWMITLFRRWSMLSVFAWSLAVFLVESHYFLGTEPRQGLIPLFACLTLVFIGEQVVRRLDQRSHAEAA